MMLILFCSEWTEFIDEIKIVQCCLHKLAHAKFQDFCCHSYNILIYVVKKMNASSFQKYFVCENQPSTSSVICVLKLCN